MQRLLRSHVQLLKRQFKADQWRRYTSRTCLLCEHTIRYLKLPRLSVGDQQMLQLQRVTSIARQVANSLASSINPNQELVGLSSSFKQR